MLITALVVVIAVAALLGWFCYRLLVDRGHLLLRLAEGETAGARRVHRPRGLPSGAYLSDFALPALSRGETGTVVALSDLAGRPLLLVFLRADCLFSRAFARELASQPPRTQAPLTVSILVGEVDDTEAWEPFGGLPGPVLLDGHRQVARLMRVTATPSGYLVDDGRKTAGRLLAGPAILLAAARGQVVTEGDEAALASTPLPRHASTARKPLAVGSIAPDFTLPTVDGDEWSLAAHRGEPLTLLFSDPDCPPCAALLAALGQRSQNRMGMVIVSRGDAEENRQLVAATGITAPVLIQRQREVARAFRTLETPAAYRIGVRGEIVAGPAVGMDTILILLEDGSSGSMNRGVSGAGSAAR
jgi:peroxiredoxin